MATVAFLGAGSMGSSMIGCLLGKGHEVKVYNRSPEKVTALVAQGAVAAATPKQAAQDAEFIIAMVGDDVASKAVWLGDEGALAADVATDCIAIECSTLSHDWVLELAQQVEACNMSYLDCPVTGLPDAAAAGKLTLFLGGSQQVIEQAQAVLPAFSQMQLNFGDVGAGTAYKLMVNLMGAVQIAAVAEGLLIAKKAGLDLDLVVKALGLGAAASPNVLGSSQKMLDAKHDQDVAFSAYWRLKDTKYGVELAKKVGQAVPLGDQAQAHFQKVIDAGFSDQADSKVIDVL